MPPLNGKDRILRFLASQSVDRPPFMPITMQFAADQIGVSYRQYATDHRLLVDAQIKTATDFDIDQVSCISDPAREASDLGAKVAFPDDLPPAIVEEEALLADKSVLARLRQPDPLGGGRMHDRVRAAELFKQRIGGEKLIEGWIEGPCAQAADLRGLMPLMMDFYDDPGFVRDLFEFVIELELSFARAQVQAGATLMGIGDAAASLVGPNLYEEFVWPYEKRLIDNVRALGVPVRLHICGNTRPILAGMGKLGCEIIDLDYLVPLDEARQVMGPNQVLLGNLEPAGIVRQGTPEQLRHATAATHTQAAPRHIIGAGCEIPRDTPAANLRAMRAAAE